MSDKISVSGKVHTWEMFDRQRTFGEVTLPFEEALQFAEAHRYNANNGKGQQREIVESHLKKIKSAMELGDYTPTPASVNASKAKGLKIENGEFALDVGSDTPLPLTDAGHRFESITRIVNDLKTKIEKTEDQKQKDVFKRWLEQALKVPITFTVYFDGDAQRDFINLQMGRPVDASHMLSIKVQQKLLEDPSYKTAFEVAKILNKSESPFKNLIRFDSRGSSPLPISTICSKGSSDLATSLIGLAKIGLSVQDEKNTSEWLANALQDAYNALMKYDSEHEDKAGILDYGKVLTPMSNQGKKGQSTMMIGLATCLSYRLKHFNRTKSNEDDINKLVDSVISTLNVEVKGNFSGPYKRQLLGSFASLFFQDLEVEKHENIPVGLIKLLSSSTFGVSPLPKQPKPVKVKVVKKKKKNSKDESVAVVVAKEEISEDKLKAELASALADLSSTVYDEKKASEIWDQPKSEPWDNSGVTVIEG